MVAALEKQETTEAAGECVRASGRGGPSENGVPDGGWGAGDANTLGAGRTHGVLGRAGTQELEPRGLATGV